LTRGRSWGRPRRDPGPFPLGFGWVIVGWPVALGPGSKER
jgi:hypothetical protein